MSDERKLIDWTKPIINGGGETVELLHTHGPQVATSYPKLCLVGRGTANERLGAYTSDGRFSTEEDMPRRDLMNVHERRVSHVVHVGAGGWAALDCSPNNLKAAAIVTIYECDGKYTAEVEHVEATGDE